MKKALVTGANGFIGSALLSLMNEKNIEVYALIKDENENIESIKDLEHIHIVYCDMEQIEDLPRFLQDEEIDSCIHLAWLGSFGDARADYRLQLKDVEWSLRLVDVLKKMGIGRFVGAGTLAEKDVLNYHMKDGATPNNVSCYGIAKLTAHFMTKARCSAYGIEHIWCYLSNTYGVGDTTNNFVNMASRKMLRGERAAFTAGEQTYDFVYIEDTVRALLAAAQGGQKNCSYFLGSTKERPLKEYITIIRDTIDPSIQLYLGEIPFNGTPLAKEEYSTEKLVRDTGYCPQISFEEGIKKTVEWLQTEE